MQANSVDFVATITICFVIRLVIALDVDAFLMFASV